MSHTAHLLTYPLVGLLYWKLWRPHSAQKKAAEEEAKWANLPEVPELQPELMNEFTPLPFHNNQELRYALAKINMRGYLNKNGLNVNEYMYRNYFQPCSQEDTSYLFDWVNYTQWKRDTEKEK